MFILDQSIDKQNERTRVVTVPVVGGVVVDVDVLERIGSHMLNVQKVGSNLRDSHNNWLRKTHAHTVPIIGADSGAQNTWPDRTPLLNRI